MQTFRVTCPTTNHAAALVAYLSNEGAFATLISSAELVVLAECPPSLMAAAARFCSI